MKRNPKKLPATSGIVGRGIKRSPGAIANCLERLEKAGKVKRTNPRSLTGGIALARALQKLDNEGWS